MAFMMKMFGGKPKGGKPNNQSRGNNSKNVANDATNKLRTTVTQLEKRENHLSNQIDQLEAKAKQLVKQKKKKKALAVLKKKKLLEGQLERAAAKKLNLETQIMQLEESIINAEVVNGMRTANAAITKVNQSFDVDKIDELREDMQEQQDMQAEVNEILGEPLMDGLIDDDELEDELAALEDLAAEEDLADLPELNTATATTDTNTADLLADLPTAPVAAKKTQAQKDEEELQALMMM